jgi:altronate hydrolase
MKERSAVQPNAVLIDARDNVVTVLQDILPGSPVTWGNDLQVAAREGILTGHKVAISPIASGATIRKYGYPIGTASAAISVGDFVHTHNLNAVKA